MLYELKADQLLATDRDWRVFAIKDNRVGISCCRLIGTHLDFQLVSECAEVIENFKLISRGFSPFFKDILDQTVLLERRNLCITAFLRAIDLLQ